MDPPLDTARHVRYWQRCLRSLLPHPYTATDSTRMLLGCFSVAAVDVLSRDAASGAAAVISAADRRRFRQWVLACQHPGGGFAGGPTHVYPATAYSGFDFGGGEAVVGARGEANIAATLFALQLLAMATDGDDDGENDGAADDGGGGSVLPGAAFFGVDRNATLRWLRRLQRPDGSFGEFLADVADAAAPGGTRSLIAGGADMRYCYIAAMIRWMLRGDRDDVADIDVDALVRYIRRGQTYDGGFAESSTHESHAGYAFCAIAALELLQRPPEGSAVVAASPDDSIFARGIADLPGLVRWLASRSFLYKMVRADGNDGNDDDDDDDEEEWQESIETAVTPVDVLARPGCHALLACNGRCNKHADSCYTWWTSGTMAILARNGLVDPAISTQDRALWADSRRFLLQETQHLIGGFAKTPGGHPDIYHSYLGLAALATRGEPSLKAFDPAMSVSLDTVKTIEAARRGMLRGLGVDGAARQAALLYLGKTCWATAETAETATAATTAAAAV